MAKKAKEELTAADVGKRGSSLFGDVAEKEVDGVVGIGKEKKEWVVTIDAVERKAVPDAQDVIGRYEVRLDENGDLVGYNQTSIRHRIDKKGIEEEFPAP